MKTNKKYKALMLDLDGTTIPNRQDGRPSQKVIEAIGKAKHKLQVSVATARPYYQAKYIVRELGLKGPSIFAGGAEIVDAKTGEVLWSKNISSQTTKEILRLFGQKEFPLWILDNYYYKKKPLYNSKNAPREPLQISITDVPLLLSDAFLKILHNFKDITVHKVESWKPNSIWLTITHSEVSKQHGIFEVAKILGIETHEIIGVGDSYNDFPLLMACGLRIAMGNAVDELKEIADYIAPSVMDDGVVDVINKFVLNGRVS